MLILSNAPNIEVGATTENYLKTVQEKEPEINRAIIYQYGNLMNFPIIEYIFGTNSVYTNGTNRLGVQQRGANSIAWPVLPNLTNRVTIVTSSAFSTHTSDDVARTLTVGPNDSWLRAGMMILIPVAGGGFQRYLIISGPVANSSNWDYQAKFVSSSSTQTYIAPLYGDGSTFATVYSQGGTNQSTKGTLTPTQAPDIYENFTSIFKYQLEVSRAEAQSKVWYYDPQTGSSMWTAFKEHEFRINVTKWLDSSAWYGERTYQSVAGNFYAVNNAAITDASGNQVMQGDGIFKQIESSNVVTCSIATYTNPTNYASYIQLLQSTITNWRIKTGISQDIELIGWAGANQIALWQSVFKDYADKAAGGISLMVNEKGGEVELGVNIRAYNFAGTRIYLRECATFNNPQIQSNYTTSTSSIPMSSYTLVLAPKGNFMGAPIFEAVFKGLEGFNGGFQEILIPGTLDPMAPSGRSSRVASGTGDVFDGYQLQTLTEIMFNVPNPQALIWFDWVA